MSPQGSHSLVIACLLMTICTNEDDDSENVEEEENEMRIPGVPTAVREADQIYDDNVGDNDVNDDHDRESGRVW